MASSDPDVEASETRLDGAHHTSAVAPVTILIWTYLDR
jgi:hypothetical protein